MKNIINGCYEKQKHHYIKVLRYRGKNVTYISSFISSMLDRPHSLYIILREENITHPANCLFKQKTKTLRQRCCTVLVINKMKLRYKHKSRKTLLRMLNKHWWLLECRRIASDKKTSRTPNVDADSIRIWSREQARDMSQAW